MGYELVSKKGYVPKFKVKQLTKQSNLNSPTEYDRIFKETTPDWQDKRRWKWLMKHYKGGRILDIGCLWSEIPEYTKRNIFGKYALYNGIDIAPEVESVMSMKYPGATYITGDLYNVYRETRGYPYDYIVIGEVLEHLDDPRKAVTEAWRVLQSGGTLAISVPLEEAKEPGAVDRHRHLWSFTEDDIINLIPGEATIKTKILRSKWFPKYRYCWPQLILWITKI